MEIVQDVRCAQELQEPKAGVSGQMEEGHAVPAGRYFNDDETDLCERGVRKRRLDIALHPRGDCRKEGRRDSETRRDDSRDRRMFEQRAGSQEQETSGMDGERPIVEGAGWRQTFPCPPTPAR